MSWPGAALATRTSAERPPRVAADANGLAHCASALRVRRHHQQVDIALEIRHVVDNALDGLSYRNAAPPALNRPSVSGLKALTSRGV